MSSPTEPSATRHHVVAEIVGTQEKVDDYHSSTPVEGDAKVGTNIPMATATLVDDQNADEAMTTEKMTDSGEQTADDDEDPSTKNKKSRFWFLAVSVIVLMAVVAIVVVVTVVLVLNNEDNDDDQSSTGNQDRGNAPTASPASNDNGGSSEPAKPFSFAGVQSANYNIVIQASSPDASCSTAGFDPLANIIATCPVGIVKQDRRCRILSNGRTAVCENVDFFGQVNIICYAQDTTSEDLQLELKVDSSPSSNHEYVCHQEIKTESGFGANSSLSSSTWTSRTYYGGTVVHTVRVEANGHVLVDNQTTSGICETMVQYDNANPGGNYTNKGSNMEICRPQFQEAPLTIVADIARVEYNPVYPFELGVRATGAECWYNVQCQSGACIQRKCAAAKLLDNQQGCEPQGGDSPLGCVEYGCEADGDFGEDCVSGACAFLTVDELATSSQSLACCSSGNSLVVPPSYPHGQGKRVCTGQPATATCFADALCASGRCVAGKCDEA